MNQNRKNKVLATSTEALERNDKWYVPYHYDGRPRDLTTPSHWLTLREYYDLKTEVQIAPNKRKEKI